MQGAEGRNHAKAIRVAAVHLRRYRFSLAARFSATLDTAVVVGVLAERASG